MNYLLAACLLLASSMSFAQEIILRHNLEGSRLGALAGLVLKFNEAQKGKGLVRLETIPLPQERRGLPHLALLDTADSMNFFGTLPRFKPLHQMLRESGQKIDMREILPQMADVVDDANGQLQALPMAMALPVIYLNREVLRKSGIDPDQAPRTWLALQEIAGALRKEGVACPLTSSQFSWVHLENLSSQHGQPVVTHQREAEKLVLNSLINVKHLALLASWQKSHYFHYSGPGQEGNERFLNGECAILTGESSFYAEVLGRGVDASISAMPYYDDVYGARRDEVLPGGAALWVLAGFKSNDYKLIARFVSFLMRSDIQSEWVRTTTFLPMTSGAISALRDTGAFPPHLLNGAMRRLSAVKKTTSRARSSPIRDRFRAILGEEMEFVWNGDRPAKEALDRAMERTNRAAPLRP
jgi:sn-glycerol 3-phosphate transport system substrate-binding protein